MYVFISVTLYGRDVSCTMSPRAVKLLNDVVWTYLYLNASEAKATKETLWFD